MDFSSPAWALLSFAWDLAPLLKLPISLLFLVEVGSEGGGQFDQISFVFFSDIGEGDGSNIVQFLQLFQSGLALEETVGDIYSFEEDGSQTINSMGRHCWQ